MKDILQFLRDLSCNNNTEWVTTKPFNDYINRTVDYVREE